MDEAGSHSNGLTEWTVTAPVLYKGGDSNEGFRGQFLDDRLACFESAQKTVASATSRNISGLWNEFLAV